MWKLKNWLKLKLNDNLDEDMTIFLRPCKIDWRKKFFQNWLVTQSSLFGYFLERGGVLKFFRVFFPARQKTDVFFRVLFQAFFFSKSKFYVMFTAFWIYSNFVFAVNSDMNLELKQYKSIYILKWNIISFNLTLFI